MQRKIGLFAAAALSTALASMASGQIFVVAPNEYANIMGTGGLNTLTRDLPRTYQIIIAESQLGDIDVGDRITGITWRGSGTTSNPPTWPATDATWDNYDIFLGESANPPMQASGTFADNRGANFREVRSGSLTIPANSFINTTNPEEWSHEITFDPYEYTGGHLLIEITHDGNDTGTAFFLDRVVRDERVQAVSAASYQALTGSTTASVTISRLTVEPGEPGLDLALSGACPGTMTADVSNATPNGQVGLVFSTETGNFEIPSGPCAGTQLGLGSRGIRLLAVIRADGQGNASATGNAGSGACGGFLQAVDAASCDTSNVEQIQ